jgi:hypothetical protein
MKITTESGSVYEITPRGYWSKNGNYHQKVWLMYCISNDVRTHSEIFATEKLPLTVGLRLYVAGKNEWALSTAIISIEEDDNV